VSSPLRGSGLPAMAGSGGSRAGAGPGAGEAVGLGAGLDDGGVEGEAVHDRGAVTGVGEGLGPAIRGEVFGDEVVAAAMIDRLVHHADVIALKGDSYRLKDRDLGRVPTAAADES